MKITRNIGILWLALWLIVFGLLAAFLPTIGGLGGILANLAIVAEFFFNLNR